ncbi:hypothetical protein [Candidatus Uabimicrobium sp. HlEnr_7]|uniref:hypothetical protein n=1 Tax=Candidatus Uabimicrobium helgolandensis TaxID=3095367 RepID=UPI0035562F23
MDISYLENPYEEIIGRHCLNCNARLKEPKCCECHYVCEFMYETQFIFAGRRFSQILSISYIAFFCSLYFFPDGDPMNFTAFALVLLFFTGPFMFLLRRKLLWDAGLIMLDKDSYSLGDEVKVLWKFEDKKRLIKNMQISIFAEERYPNKSELDPHEDYMDDCFPFFNTTLKGKVNPPIFSGEDSFLLPESLNPPRRENRSCRWSVQIDYKILWFPNRYHFYFGVKTE